MNVVRQYQKLAETKKSAVEKQSTSEKISQQQKIISDVMSATSAKTKPVTIRIPEEIAKKIQQQPDWRTRVLDAILREFAHDLSPR